MTNQEINEAVARKLGWTERELPGNISPWTGKTVEGKYLVNPKTNNGESIPDYCHCIAAAWEIVEKFQMSIKPIGGGWVAEAGSVLNYTHAIDRTAPMAICLAFLKLP